MFLPVLVCRIVEANSVYQAGAVTDTEASQRTALEKLADRNIHLRLFGLLYVLIGLVLSWLGNLT